VSYLNTGDKVTIEKVYDGVKRYLDVWNLYELLCKKRPLKTASLFRKVEDIQFYYLILVITPYFKSPDS
jgi:hypothetical protein